MLKTVELYNEKDNVKVAVRNAIKKSAMPILEDALKLSERDVVLGNDGAFYVALALDEKGGTIYARLDVTISTKNPHADVETASKDAVVVEL